MGQEIKQEDWENLKTIKRFILKEHTDIAPPLIYTKVGKTKLQGIESIEEHRVYRIAVEKIDCNAAGKERDRATFIMRYLIVEGTVKSLEGYLAEKKIRSKKRKRKGVLF